MFARPYLAIASSRFPRGGAFLFSPARCVPHMESTMVAALGKTALTVRRVTLLFAFAPIVAAGAQTGVVVGRVIDRGSTLPLEAVRIQAGPTLAVQTDA